MLVSQLVWIRGPSGKFNNYNANSSLLTIEWSEGQDTLEGSGGE
jgi:hypothetical protein